MTRAWGCVLATMTSIVWIIMARALFISKRNPKLFGLALLFYIKSPYSGGFKGLHDKNRSVKFKVSNWGSRFSTIYFPRKQQFKPLHLKNHVLVLQLFRILLNSQQCLSRALSFSFSWPKYSTDHTVTPWKPPTHKEANRLPFKGRAVTSICFTLQSMCQWKGNSN